MTTVYNPRPERWPQVSLRGLFVLVTLLGVACWLGVQLKWRHDRYQTLLELLFEQGHDVRFERPEDRPQLGPWPIRMLHGLGIQTFVVPKIVFYHPVSAAETERIKRLFPEAQVTARPPHDSWFR